MDWQAWTSLGLLGAALGLLAFSRLGPDVVLLGALVVLLISGVLTPGEALNGFANEGLATVAVLYVVAAAMKETGALAAIVQRILGRPASIGAAQARLMLPVALLSAFMNNTPLVAMMLPMVGEWAKRCRLSVSKLMIPLSYAAILGGTCTLIGTSTNLVVMGLLREKTVNGYAGLELPRLFDIAWVGLPCAVAGIAYILVVHRWLLPDRKPPIGERDDPREYTVEMVVESGSPLAEKSIEEAGLRHLPNLYLMEIDRGGRVLAAVSAREKLLEGDRLVFVGVVDSIVDLQKIRGLAPATDQVFKLDAPRSQRSLMEAVVSNTCPLVGRTIRDGRFRAVYNAAIIAVARNGERLRQKIGDIVLRPGDTLLMEAHPSFADQQRNSRDFYLVSQVEDSAPPRHERAPVALAVLAAMVIVAGTGVLSMFQAALAAAGVLLATRCLNGAEARAALDGQVLLTIGASFGLGAALTKTGAAAAVSGQIIALAGGHPWAALAAVYLATMLFTALITNNAAAALVFPIAFATAAKLGASPLPFAIAIMMAASNDFATPIGYATNLMVYGPGGYRFGDYVRFGVPLNLLVAAIAVGLIPLIWAF